MARRPTQWTVTEVGLEDGMELLQYAWFRHYKDRATLRWGPSTQGCQFLEIEQDSFQGLSDSRTARCTPTSNPYLTYAPISGRGTQPIGT
ncbi:hypothetical protein CRG98_000225 [Punica granatum]|uniref:Uncharacterized protein n=1 Tax=Punica granatum TaxID=22663 RepID=A0A2I0LFC2_PUNGR|nr:hypothetical protein CRG98_000225 [Punica granatum]